jgi:hypothetical protein
MESEVLSSNPKWVQFNAVDADGVTNKAFMMLAVKEHGDGSISGSVWCDDVPNTVGLSDGWNTRRNVQPGAPGQNDTFSEIVDHSD